LQREPNTGLALLAELEAAQHQDPDFDAELNELRPVLEGQAVVHEVEARRWVEALALALQASLLLRSGSPMADAFCTSRIGGDHGNAYGTLPRDFELGTLIGRAWQDG
jgi:putative acyl-CoA dehydrogenase